MPRTTAGQRQIVRDFGTALSFNGTNSQVSISAGASIQIAAFTFTAWIYPKTISANQAIITSTGNGSNGGYEWRINNTGKLELLKCNVASIGTSTGSLAKNNWYHIAASYNAGAFVFYINGAASGSGSNSQTFVNSSTVYLGRQVVSEYYNGLMDDVRIYNTVLDVTTIQNMYYGIVPANTNLKAWYKLDEGSGTTADDSSGNSNTGTISNATYSSSVFMTSRSTAGDRTIAGTRSTVT